MQKKKRIQNKVAESRYALPITATLISLIWVAVGLLEDNIWIQFGILALSTFFMLEFNNRNALMRTYSRMISCSFVVLTTMATLPLPSIRAGIVALCLIAFYLIIWNTYQDKKGAGNTFFAFAFIGIATTQWIQVAYYLPFLWIVMLTFILSLSFSTFFASLVGILIPYWFLSVYYIFISDFDSLISHFLSIANFQPLFDYSQVDMMQIVNFTFISLIGIIGTIHFLRNSYADKIRTRMIYESIILLNIVTMAFIVLQPQHYRELIGIQIVNTAPLIAHFITFTRTRITNAAFVMMLITAGCIMLLNIWISSSVFL